MTFKNFFFALMPFLLFSSGADAVTVIENSGQGTIIESRTSAVSDTGGNSGSGKIDTGDAKSVSTTEVRSSGSETTVKSEALSEADGREASVRMIQEGPGAASVEEQEGGAEARIDVSVSEKGVAGASSEESSGVFEKVGAFLSGIGDFIRSIFE